MLESSPSVPLASVIICTYRRDDVLVQTVGHLLPQVAATGAELLVIDQLAEHPPAIQAALEQWASEGKIRYENLDRSGLTNARNVGAKLANGSLLLYFDDDIIPGADLIRGHVDAYADPRVGAVAGQVLNVGEGPVDSPGSFSHCKPIEEFTGLYGANFSVRRDVYFAMGGSDENLSSVHAYTEDQILAHRVRTAGYRIRYESGASVIHLVHSTGGCRIADETQPTDESEKSFSKLYWMFVANHLPVAERGRLFWDALRHGPLRRQNVEKPWRQPIAWIGFGRATVNAYRKARMGASGQDAV
ncbi:MAG: glycosyltransferase [Myxococcales bacterium]